MKNKKSKIRPVTLALVMVLILSGCGQKKENKYGKQISDYNLTNIDAILKDSEDYDGKTVTVQGKIILECPVGGWFNLQQDAAILFVDLHPSGFVIPQKTGHIVTVQGTLKIRDKTPTLIGTGVEIK
jgi:starvation-inducible outer membrane lipoprotein